MRADEKKEIQDLTGLQLLRQTVKNAWSIVLKINFIGNLNSKNLFWHLYMYAFSYSMYIFILTIMSIKHFLL